MAKMFLLFESVIVDTFSEFQSGIDELILIDKEEGDVFYKNNSLDEVENYYELYQQYTQENQVRAKYLEQLTPSTANPKTIDELAQVFPNSAAGFFGIIFPKLGIDEKFCVRNNIEFMEFKLFFSSLLFASLSSSNFSKLKKDCFPKIDFCGESEQQLLSFGDGKFFRQCIEQLYILQNQIKDWKTGVFNYQDVIKNTALNISPESSSTMGKYKHERLFSTPKGGSSYFDLHIKLGNLRIYILEDNDNKKIFVGYIGPHLTI